VFDTGNKHQNVDFKFTFLETCFQQPMTVWPHDPLGRLSLDDPFKNCFDKINRNQAQQI
jgi:hypothetical protein